MTPSHIHHLPKICPLNLALNNLLSNKMCIYIRIPVIWFVLLKRWHVRERDGLRFRYRGACIAEEQRVAAFQAARGGQVAPAVPPVAKVRHVWWTTSQESRKVNID